MKNKYRPRNDVVLFRAVPRGQTDKGVLVPETARDGKDFFAVAVGPDVKDIAPGDRLMIAAASPNDVAEVPHEQDLFLVKQANVLLVVVAKGGD